MQSIAKQFYLWTRDLHLYLRLAISPFILVFALRTRSRYGIANSTFMWACTFSYLFGCSRSPVGLSGPPSTQGRARLRNSVCDEPLGAFSTGRAPMEGA